MQYFLTNMQEYLQKKKLHSLQSIEKTVFNEDAEIIKLKEKLIKNWNSKCIPQTSQQLYDHVNA